MYNKIIIFLGFIILAQTLHGAAYSIPEQSTRSIGMAAAMTAVEDDVGSIYFNPANLGFIEEGSYLKSSSLLISFNGSFERAADSLSSSGYERKKNLSKVNYVPFVGAGKKYKKNSDFFGFALYSPFGLRSPWNKSGPQRYMVTDSHLRTVFLVPTYARKITDNLSLGAGLNMVHSQLILERQAPLGNVLYSQTGNVSFLENPTYDSPVEIDMKDHGSFSGNFGMSYKLSNRSRIGLVYRSQTNMDFKGKYRVNNIHSSLSSLGSSFESPAASELSLPQSAGFGYAHKTPTNRLFSLDVQWYDWSVVDHVPIDLEIDSHPVFKDQVIDRNWKDTWSIRSGYEFPLKWEGLIGRVGGFYENTPINNERLDPILLSNDVLGLSCGLSLDLDEGHIELGYMHLFTRSRNVNNSLNDPASNGKYHYSLDIIGLSFLKHY
ncbi:OmpP1/FadL family transporter [Candidatus Riflebacteria bacterium]